jgi:SAM-dependent methyltransferase
MLTVDYDKLGLLAGETLLDLGCGFGRHSYEALRRGANVVACDLGLPELHQVQSIYAGMQEDGTLPAGVACMSVNGDATRLPFTDAAFHRVIASEVLEHIPDDATAFAELTRVLRPGGIMAVTVPAFVAERVCWAITDEYHAPKATGGHVRIYRRSILRDRMRSAGLEPLGSHRTHGLHSPYWWLRCAVGVTRPIDDNRFTKAYHRLLCWDIEKAPAATRLADQALNPLIGKSLVVYARKPFAFENTAPQNSAAQNSADRPDGSRRVVA